MKRIRRTLPLALVFTAGLALGLVPSLRAQPPVARKAYLVVLADITDPGRYAEYAKLSPGILAAHGGKYLARAGRMEALEGPPFSGRVVVAEFPSYEAARGFYTSPEYTKARALRAGAADARFVIVEGME
jgi:uncharacterized protein (DUF1330 family)